MVRSDTADPTAAPEGGEGAGTDGRTDKCARRGNPPGNRRETGGQADRQTDGRTDGRTRINRWERAAFLKEAWTERMKQKIDQSPLSTPSSTQCYLWIGNPTGMK